MAKTSPADDLKAHQLALSPLVRAHHYAEQAPDQDADSSAFRDAVNERLAQIKATFDDGGPKSKKATLYKPLPRDADATATYERASAVIADLAKLTESS